MLGSGNFDFHECIFFAKFKQTNKQNPSNFHQIRYEEPTLVYTTLSVSLLEPVYIIMKLAALLNAHQEHSPFVSRLPILLSGLFALLSRGAFLYSYTKCKRNFGKGLKARLVNNIDKTNREATPILGRTLRGARGYGSMTL
eukprot:Sdes_comp20367_c0_seq3m14187